MSHLLRKHLGCLRPELRLLERDFDCFLSALHHELQLTQAHFFVLQ